MDGDQPCGGTWNFDADNREAFGAGGPGAVPPRVVVRPAPGGAASHILLRRAQHIHTQPPVVGEEAVRNLLSLQDSLPPVPFDLIKAQMVAGGFDIFKGPLKDNKGKEVIPAGKSLKQTDLTLEGMNYLVEGVVGSI